CSSARELLLNSPMNGNSARSRRRVRLSWSYGSLGKSHQTIGAASAVDSVAKTLRRSSMEAALCVSCVGRRRSFRTFLRFSGSLECRGSESEQRNGPERFPVLARRTKPATPHVVRPLQRD